ALPGGGGGADPTFGWDVRQAGRMTPNGSAAEGSEARHPGDSTNAGQTDAFAGMSSSGLSRGSIVPRTPHAHDVRRAGLPGRLSPQQARRSRRVGSSGQARG